MGIDVVGAEVVLKDKSGMAKPSSTISNKQPKQNATVEKCSNDSFD